MIGFYVVEIRDKGEDEFEDEHDVISAMQISFLVFLECIFFLFFICCLHQESTHVGRFSNIILVYFLELESFHIEIVLIKVRICVFLWKLIFLIKVFVLVYAYFGF